MKWLLGALIVALTACTATPASQPSRRPEPTTTAPTTTTQEYTDEEFIRGIFTGFVGKVNSSNGTDAKFYCTIDSYRYAETVRQHALTSAEAQVAQLPTLQRLLVYALRQVQPPGLRTEGDAAALESVLTVSNGFVAPAELTGLTVNGKRATATVPQTGTDPVPVTFVDDVTGHWALDFPALIAALSGALDQLATRRGLTSAQLVDQVLANRFGAGRAAELRVPLK